MNYVSYYILSLKFSEHAQVRVLATNFHSYNNVSIYLIMTIMVTIKLLVSKLYILSIISGIFLGGALTLKKVYHRSSS